MMRDALRFYVLKGDEHSIYRVHKCIAGMKGSESAPQHPNRMSKNSAVPEREARLVEEL